MNWKYVKKIKDKNTIDMINNSNIPMELKQLIKQYNGGRPEKNIFDTKSSKERVLKSLISYNKEDKENIYMYEKIFNKGLIPFAVTEFGDIICINTETSEVELYLHEQDKTEKISDGISEFFDKLYV